MEFIENRTNKIKVLWFTNTPSLAKSKVNQKTIGGGWIKSLEQEIIKSKKINLGISFYSDDKYDDFEQGETNYFPIIEESKSFKLLKLYNRITSKIEPDSDVSKFVKIIKEFKPDLIHVLGSEGPFGLIQKYIKDIPIVISIQGNLTVYNDKYFSGFSKQDVKKHSSFKSKILFDTPINHYKRFKKRVLREQVILKLSKNIIGRTDWDRRITRILSPDSTYYHNDEILRDSFYQHKWKPQINEEIILFTTTGSNLYKGIETILKSAKHLDDIGIKYKWKIAGISSNDEILDLVAETFKIEVSKNMIFLGKISEKELVNNLLKSSMYIMASHIENSPNNLCEAMILGVPCIASNAGGTSSLLQNKKEGILIQDGDSWVLAGAILELINDKDMAIKYGEKARVIAMQRHNPDKIVNEILEIYNRII